MNLFLRQIWALIRKNLLLICARRPISTFIRAIAIPLVVVLVVAYSKNFFASVQNWGISDLHSLRSLKDGLAASPHRDIVGFVDNGMKGGAVSSVIDSLSRTVREAGKTPKLFDSTWGLAQECADLKKGASPCYGAVIFLSSPDQGSNISAKGVWNYTIRGDKTADTTFVDVTTDINGFEVYLLPLQRAVDMEIVARSMSGNRTSLPQKINDIIFTRESNAVLLEDRENNYLSLCITIFGVIFSFCMIGIVYHITSYVATERELGMSSLIDTMIPGGSATRARLVRQISTYFSFAMIYLPSWLAVGIVLDVVVFPVTSRGIPIGYLIFSGFAFCSFSLFGASFFKKAQLSGSIMSVIVLVFAILPQVLSDQKWAQAFIFSLIFPSANYTYFITGLAVWEARGEKVDMMASIPDERYYTPEWRPRLYLLWICTAIQIVVYPVLAHFVERVLFGTTTPGRRFVTPEDNSAPTVTLANFYKTYKPGFFARIFKRRKNVHAVVDMSLEAYRGQILCLLGPNGSGKSTTLNSIAGETKVTSGVITIDPTGGLGYAPQANVIWPELTVEEHIRIFSDLKCTAAVNEEIITELVKSCDLQEKLPAKAKTLSGGQKRKLQMAMMFAGGSAVCCVDEVSTGLDPISRRRIWEILLAERRRRTIIMTTHFLDEADYLADTIAIMYKGSLKVQGTAVALKNQFGNGYTIKVPNNLVADLRLPGPVDKEASRHQTVYRVATPALAAQIAGQLEHSGFSDYQMSGPTMEELFLKVTGDSINSSGSTAAAEEAEKEDVQELGNVVDTEAEYKLTAGRPISAFKQWWVLFCKRFQILRRRYIPYFVTIAFALVGAGASQKLLKSFKHPLDCPSPADEISDTVYRWDPGQMSSYAKYVIGPADKIDEGRLAQLVDVYSTKYYTQSAYSYYKEGYSNASQLRDQFTIIDTLDEFTKLVQTQQNGKNEYGSYRSSDVDGGIWLADPPTVMVHGQVPNYGSTMLNFMNVLLSGVPISAGYSEFTPATKPKTFTFEALTFMLYFGLIMACYPAFFALYPTNERVSNVRSMQYSNGARPLPLWLSHLAFDGIFVLVISVVGVALLSISTPVWQGLGYVFLVMFLYGIVSALLSYLISMFARSAVTAWFMCALGQIVFYFAYFGGLIGVQSAVNYQDWESMNNKVFFGLGIISPAVSLERTFAIGLGQLALRCNGHELGSINLYGGPILYLVLQAVVLFGILLWWDSSFVLPSHLQRRPQHDHEAFELDSPDIMAELTRLKSPSSDLCVSSVSKSFGRNPAVSNISFCVQTSEIFALLGPNGAGKSTLISMIRGDIKPSARTSSITIAHHSILTSPISARANLGVCPQFDSTDVLTVGETLHFYAKLRGVQDIRHNISTALSLCGLTSYTNSLSSTLSGGTKRKLSLAIALIGNPSVLVLDEPSSALDASSKRVLWRTLQLLSKGRAVLLTTHSMEECDALADRIGIVSTRMLAIGEREEVKRRAGGGVRVHLVAKSAPRSSEAELERIKEWVLRAFVGARVEREGGGGQVRFEVPVGGNGSGSGSGSGSGLVELINILEEEKDAMGIEFYGISRATLDEVFENIVGRYGGTDEGRGEKNG